MFSCFWEPKVPSAGPSMGVSCRRRDGLKKTRKEEGAGGDWRRFTRTFCLEMHRHYAPWGMFMCSYMHLNFNK